MEITVETLIKISGRTPWATKEAFPPFLAGLFLGGHLALFGFFQFDHLWVVVAPGNNVIHGLDNSKRKGDDVGPILDRNDDAQYDKQGFHRGKDINLF